MQEHEFDDLMEAVIDQLLPRMPQRFLDVYEGYLQVGEDWRLVQGLVWVLVDDRVPVSVQERERLYQMVNHLADNEEMLAKMGGLTVESSDR